jgi:hypothetical protein
VQFLNPGLVAGALLFAVPLVIHLLNRQRHKRRDWAAMEFLLRAFQKTRNRLRNENLLLLLLRCLIPIVLALALARPVLQSVAALIGQGGSVHHVVVLDQSYSMGLQRDGAPSPSERGRAMVARLLEDLQSRPEAADKVTLVTAGVRPRFVVLKELNLTLAKALWQELPRTEDAASELAPALLQVAQALDEDGETNVQIHVISDLQMRSFGKALQPTTEAATTTGPDFTDTLRDTVERLRTRDGTQVHWIDVGPMAEQKLGGSIDNGQLTGLRCDQPIALSRTPIVIVASLRNRSAARATVQVTLDVDGAEPARKQVQLEAGAEGEAEFQITLREPGRHRLHAAIEQDGLDADDEWHTVLDVRDRLRVLVVDGAADDDPLKTQSYFWRGMLDPADLGARTAERELAGALGMFDVTVIDTLALLSGQQTPADYDVTILADVDRLNERATDGLERALRAGKGVLVTIGRRADPASYDQQLFAAGEGPMPFRLGQRSGAAQGSATPRSPSIQLPNHATLREFDEAVYREILQAIPVYQWYATAADSLTERAEVVLRLSDPDQSPLLVTTTFDGGRAAFLSSAPGSEYDGQRWNRLDDPFVAFPLLHGLVQWLALPAQDAFHVEVGAELTCSLPARPTDIEVLLPERASGKKLPISTEPRALPGGRYALPPFSQTTMAGFYTIELQLERDTGKEPSTQHFAVHVDPEEGALDYAPHANVQQALSLDTVHTSMPKETERAADADDDELAPSLLLMTLLLVLGEAAMARYVSVRRS